MRRCVGGVVVAVTAVVVAVGSMASAQQETAVQLVLTDYRFSPGQLVLQAGQTYRLQVVNRGANEHELMIGRGGPVGDGPMEEGQGEETHGYKHNFFEGMEVLVRFEGGAVEVEELVELELEPGASATLVFTVPVEKRGEWELGCFVPGHYELGMHGKLTVR